MTPPEDWRRAMHARDQQPLRLVAQGLAIVAAILSLGLIAVDLGMFGAGCAAGSVGLAAAGLLWWEV